jgi:farnesyl-diphosphate farnesyltransferase
MSRAKVDTDKFISEFIPKVSRTFALTIKFLPKNLRRTVYASYLLCRVADTLEDSPILDPDDKKDRLMRLHELLDGASAGSAIRPDDIKSLYEEIGTEHGDDHRLLNESAALFEILESLPADHRSIVYRRAGEMAGGMAEYTRLRTVGDERIAALTSVDDWNRYCYYVAGTVGHMLTEMFVITYDFGQDTRGELNRLGESFGLGLQKVNVIKDVPDDRKRGVCYIPLELMTGYDLLPSALAETENSPKISGLVSDLVRLTVGHLDDAMEYAIQFPPRLKGVRTFLVLPIFLALETLALVASNPVRSMTGPPLKLGRHDVSRLVAAATMKISSDKALKAYSDKLRSKIP